MKVCNKVTCNAVLFLCPIETGVSKNRPCPFLFQDYSIEGGKE